MAGRLAGKVALITGAASGLGACSARLMVQEGARVVITDVQEDAGRRLAGEIGEAAQFVALDVTSVLLLLRKSVANYLFVASLLGVIVTTIHTFGLAGSTISVSIGMGTLMSLVVAAFLIWYSKHAESKGWVS